MNKENYGHIYDYIQANPTAVLGTLEPNNTPYGSIVYVCADAQLPCVYFVTKNQTRKYRNLITHPAVSLTIYNAETQSTLQAIGQATVTTDPHTLEYAFESLTKNQAVSSEMIPPIGKLRAGEYVVIAVNLTEARLANFAGRDIGSPEIFINL